ncbi:hypothetical protein T492DRAFT_1035027 [Pavlovales sp. CCMP2436]|nr:hypothetical protein T492DRAFT_1035027 [Pavlovales sp. CCMP2436]
MSADDDELAANGQPFPSDPAARAALARRAELNAWARKSATLSELPDDPVKSTHPFVVAQPCGGVGGGLGLYVYMGIEEGEVVWAERAKVGAQTNATPRTLAWIEALSEDARRAYTHFMYKTGDDEFQSLAEFNELPPEQYACVRTADISNYMNHSCDPACWFVQSPDGFEGVMVARRALVPGDQLTFDYATSEDCEIAGTWACSCGAPSCRGKVSPDDWQLEEVQSRYAGHCLPHIESRIAAQRAARSLAALPPLEAVPVETTWWLRCQDEPDYGMSPTQTPEARAVLPAERKAFLKECATGAALELLNRQAAALISQHKLTAQQNERVGRFIEAGRAIEQGEIVMLLPPNLLLWEEEVDDYNRCLQLGASASGARLFSSSIRETDLDNFICHSCEPNCDVVIGTDMTAALVATRPIAKGDSVCFDYDSTEDDLRDEKGGFSCHCGAPRCRGEVLGRNHASSDKDLPVQAALVTSA